MNPNSNVSENEDDPEVYESSGDDWKETKKANNRRLSQRLSKKPKVTVVETESSEDEDDDDDDSDDSEPRKRKSKNGVNNKNWKASSESNSSNSNDDGRSDAKSETGENKDSSAAGTQSKGLHRKFIPKTIYSDDYATGTFVINKKDAQVGDPSKHPCIWRIDGKALLQKYEAFDQEGKVRHKNTSIYTGWSPMDKDQYAPVTVDVIHHNNQNLTVELRWDKLKEITIDSD